MGSESAARLGEAQIEHAKKRRAFIVTDENMEHFKAALCGFISEYETHEADSPALVWAKSTLKTVNQ